MLELLVNVLLIHGLGRTPLSMWGLAHFLRSHAYTPHLFSYWAWKDPYETIVEALQSQLSFLASQGDYSIVSHSLGGILSRSALKNCPHKMPKRVVMLGTPNQLPRLAQMARSIPIYQWVTQECGHNLSQPSFYEQLPPLTCPYTIIAGTGGLRGPLSPFGDDLNDGVVAFKETFMKESDRPLRFPVLHTFMMNHSKIQDAILYLLKTF